MAKILQCSDLHFGACRDLPNYLARHRDIKNQITALAIELQFPLAIIGDLTHSKTTKHEERFLIDEWLGDLERYGIETVVTGGNHDYLYDDVTQLDGYTKMPFKHVRVVPWYPRTYIINDIGFICLPWQGYNTEGIETAVNTLLPQVLGCRYKVVLLHECIAGSKGNNGYIIPKGTKIPDIPEVTYWGIGDLHSFQPANRANAWYAGAPAQFNFDDDLPKGVIVVDLDRPSQKPEFIPLTVKPLKTVKSVAEVTEDAYYKVVGSFEEVLEANFNENVIKSDLEAAESFDDTEYCRTEITEGLTNFLAAKGINPEYQEYAIKWVENLLNIHSSEQERPSASA